MLTGNGIGLRETSTPLFGVLVEQLDRADVPQPKVTSSVVRLVPRKTPEPCDRRALEQVAAAAFGQRRKMLRQALKGLAVPADILLEKAGIDGTKRAEQLDVVMLCKLSQTYQRLLIKPGMPS